ncbi:MAG: cytochrome c biogenesis protein CcsA [Deferribacterota bacterium]|nr:cytochrome c biogenesis protein CcsA [Deferribacterota bacterium]
MLNLSSFTLYVFSFFLFLFGYIKESKKGFNVAFLLFIFALLINFIIVLSSWYEFYIFPTISFNDTLLFLNLVIAIMFLFFYIVYKNTYLFVFILPFIIALFIVTFIFKNTSVVEIQKNTLLLYIHLPFSIIGTALFFISSFCGIVYFYQERQLKKKNMKFINGMNIPLFTINRLLNNFLISGFIIFTIGLITGFIWRFYTVDIDKYQYEGKLIFSIITWLVFGVLISLKKIKGLTPKAVALGSIIGMFALITTYIGLAIFLTG